MFESLFDNAEEVSDKPTTIKEDVDWILDNTNYILLRAAWNEFLHILSYDRKYDEDIERDDLEGRACDSWYGLKNLSDNEYDFTNFTIYELNQLRALKEGYIIYDEILHILSDHHDDTKEGKLLFESHPEIQKHVPAEYNNPKQILEVLAEVSRVYRCELEQFSAKYCNKIEEAIKTIAQDYLKSIKG